MFLRRRRAVSRRPGLCAEPAQFSRRLGKPPGTCRQSAEEIPGALAASDALRAFTPQPRGRSRIACKLRFLRCTFDSRWYPGARSACLASNQNNCQRPGRPHNSTANHLCGGVRLRLCRGEFCFADEIKPAHPLRRHADRHAGHAQPRRSTVTTSCKPTATTSRRGFYPNRQINRGNVAQAAPGLDLPDRHHGIDGDVADRGERRHVCDDLVRPRLCARRAHRRGKVGVQAEARPDHHLLLRAEQSRRRRL